MIKERRVGKMLFEALNRHVLFLFFVVLFTITSATVFSKSPKSSKSKKSSVPLWVSDIDKAFPPDVFIARIGKGVTEADAQANASGQLALFFDTSIERTASALYNAKEVGGVTSEARTVDVATQVKSNVSLQGVMYTSDYFDKKTKLHLVAAYLEKSKVFLRYDEEIAALMTDTEGQILLAQKEDNLWNAIEHCDVARAQRGKALSLIYTASVIAPKPGYYSDDIDMLSSMDNLFSSLKKKFPISCVVLMNGEGGDTQVINNLVTLAKDAFGKAGYTFSSGGTPSKLRIVFSSDERAQESDGLTLYTIREASVTIEKYSEVGDVVSKSYTAHWSGKSSSYRRDKAYFKVVSSLEGDLKAALSKEAL